MAYDVANKSVSELREALKAYQQGGGGYTLQDSRRIKRRLLEIEGRAIPPNNQLDTMRLSDFVRAEAEQPTTPAIPQPGAYYDPNLDAMVIGDPRFPIQNQPQVPGGSAEPIQIPTQPEQPPFRPVDTNVPNQSEPNITNEVDTGSDIPPKPTVTAEGYDWVWNGFNWEQVQVGETRAERLAREYEAGAERRAEEARLLGEQQQRQSAFEVLRERFTAYGLTELAGEIEKIFKGEGKTRAGSAIPIPTSEQGFYLALIETEPYYKRFGRANEMRIKAGYKALDERTILEMEDEYQKVLKAYNMPAGFYDQPEDYQKFIENDLSELELADRLQASRQFAQQVDPAIKDRLKAEYNIDESMLTAYVADPLKGQDILNKLASRSLTAAAAILQGLTADTAQLAEQFGAGELRFAEQQQRFGAAGAAAERGRFLTDIEKARQEVYGETEAIEEAFGGLESARRARQRLSAREVGRFSGTAGTSTVSLQRGGAGSF